MRKLVIVLSAAVAAACGGSSSSTPPPPTALGGKIAGQTFTPVETRAMLLTSGSTPCVFPNPGGAGTITVGFRAVVIETASYAGVCGDLTSAVCQVHPNTQNVTALVAKVDMAGGDPALGPGTYQASSDFGMIIAPGYGGWAQTLAVGADPTSVTTSTTVSGSIRLDSVPSSGSSPVTGHLALTFDGGNSITGDFSAQYCTTGLPNACALAGTLFQAIAGGATGHGICAPP
jgi:hypothetical protein